jgi:hypothetical protein
MARAASDTKADRNRNTEVKKRRKRSVTIAGFKRQDALLRMLAVTALLTTLVAACTARPAIGQTTDSSSKLGVEKIAEMTALVRHNEHCREVPRQWSIAYLMLLTTATPTEEQVVTKEREMLALSGKLGNKKWCELYSMEMEQAYVIYRLATQR